METGRFWRGLTSSGILAGVPALAGVGMMIAGLPDPGHPVSDFFDKISKGDWEANERNWASFDVDGWWPYSVDIIFSTDANKSAQLTIIKRPKVPYPGISHSEPYKVFQHDAR